MKNNIRIVSRGNRKQGLMFSDLLELLGFSCQHVHTECDTLIHTLTGKEIHIYTRSLHSSDL